MWAIIPQFDDTHSKSYRYGTMLAGRSYHTAKGAKNVKGFGVRHGVKSLRTLHPLNLYQMEMASPHRVPQLHRYPCGGVGAVRRPISAWAYPIGIRWLDRCARRGVHYRRGRGTPFAAPFPAQPPRRSSGRRPAAPYRSPPRCPPM